MFNRSTLSSSVSSCPYRTREERERGEKREEAIARAHRVTVYTVVNGVLVTTHPYR